MGKLLIFCSGKGGVGKSTVAAAMAVAAADEGFRTLLVETDAGLRCQDLMLGVSDRLVFDVFDVLCSGRELEDALIPCDEKGLLNLLSAPALKVELPKEKIMSLCVAAASRYDYVLLDCPAGIDKELFAVLPKGAAVMVVTNGTEVALRDAENLRRTVLAKTGADCFLIINRFSYKNIKKGRALGIDDAVDTTGVGLLGVVPEDEGVGILDSPRFLKTRAFKALKRIVRRIEGCQVPLPKAKKI